MKKSFVTKAVIAGGVAAAAVSFSADDANAAKKEKCFGVSKAGKNDCGVNSISCAGQAPKDFYGDGFLVVPKGMCEKLAGGSLKPVGAKSTAEVK